MKKLLKLLGKYKKYAILTPIFVFLEVVFDTVIPVIMGLIIDNGINGPNGSDIPYVLKMGGIMIVLSLLAMLTGALSGHFGAVASTGFTKHIRIKMFNRIQDYSFANIDKFSTASLVTRLTNDNMQIRMAFMMMIRMLARAPLLLIFSTFMVLKINASLAVVFLIAIPILGTGLFLISSKAHPRFKVMMRKIDAMNADLQENLVGIRVVKTFVRGEYEKAKFRKSSDGVRNQQRFAEKLVILNNPFFELVMYSCMIAISWLGGQYMIAGDMTVGDFMTYISYIRQVLFSLMLISMSLMQIIIAQASIDRVLEVIEEDLDITDDGNDEKLLPTDGSIEFKNVNFKYFKTGKKNVLSDINLKIESGQTVGIIGGTGSAKSSLVQLIPRLYEVTEGEVLVGGVDVRKYKLDNLRNDVAMVLQKNVLFSGTIKENIKWGKPDATDEEVIEACKAAQADDFISSFPNGYETELGQGGVNVSGGQQQRLCIARALMKKPKIIILDDSTSAVDTDTDKRIRTALKEKLAGMTTIIIAQRIASVQDADLIVVMDDGKIIETGNHESLLESSEIYRDLYYSQLQGVEG
ncbi:MAG: ABC transporter ATP-binding protein [Christensenellaceae bacterium]|nr:ABC transporter ATP-binding protein [Christensenellaceae bacterium]